LPFFLRRITQDKATPNFLEVIMFRTQLAALFVMLSTVAAHAQESWWVQIAARPTLAEATDFARNAAARLSGVHGFYLGNGFYAIAVGPFDRAEADRARLRLLGSAAIPSDSYVTSGGTFDRQFWPVGGGIVSPAPVPAPAPTELSSLPDETVSEARNSESLLSRSEREELQRALQWAGFYNSSIDGAFGRGTRAAMEAWQIANAIAPTGVLTTRQRAMLISDYNAVLESLGLAFVSETETGIGIQIPTAAVAFTEYQPPFAKFEATGDIPDARVLLISQRGDPEQLRGLYEIMQSLDIVPLDGSRTISADRFVIEGADDRITSYTEARLAGGAIKGFTLVWPADDQATRDRLLAEMQASFTVLDGTLDPDIVPVTEDQSIDMVAGLAIRQPQLSRSGFFVSGEGQVLTTIEATTGCGRITVDRETDMSVVASDPTSGLSLLAPLAPQTPSAFARFDDSTPRLRDRVAVAGFPYGGVLADPTLTFGEIADLRDLTGDTRLMRLEMTTQAPDAGGPLLNGRALVSGILLPRDTSSAQVLPVNVSFALKTSEIISFLSANGIVSETPADAPQSTPVAVTRLAADIGVLVSCW
jgi:peptidoglycan hydrolase-like protein with peptidoglycan-binding domain